MMENKDSILRVSLAQYSIVWEDKEANLKKIEHLLTMVSAQSDILILPEMCTTGFTMYPHKVAETNEGYTVNQLKKWAEEYDIAICGSFVGEDGGKFYNRGFFITPDSEHYYDKRHLFRMGEEHDAYASGEKRLIVEHKGFNICLLICYDLRFPVWARNVDNEYDLLIYVANWPTSRVKVWDTLLEARALENMCYVCGVNRIGEDGAGLAHCGSSKLINSRGEVISSIELNQEQVQIVNISKHDVEKLRAKFPVWMDADKFKLL